MGLDVGGHLGMMRVARPSNDNALPDKARLCIGLQSPAFAAMSTQDRKVSRVRRKSLNEKIREAGR
jgi:hypothetical protein